MELTGDVLRGKTSTCTQREIKKLEEVGVPRIPEILSKHGIDPEETAKLLLGKHEKPYLGQIIRSDIDVDQIDYLSRDSHFTGVALGRIDIDRLMRTLKIKDEELTIQRKGVEAVEGLLTAPSANVLFSLLSPHYSNSRTDVS